MASSNDPQGKKKGRRTASLHVDEAFCRLKEEEFQRLSEDMLFLDDWDAECPSPNVTAVQAPPGKIALYTSFFTHCNFRLPITTFTMDILNYYGFHLSQMHPMGMCRVKFFEFCAKANGYDPTVDMFRVFYKLTVNESWLSFRARGGVSPHVKAAPKSFHEWKSKFFFISENVIPVAMNVRDLGMEVVDETLVEYKSEDWYKRLIRHPVDICPIDEVSLVKVGMSRFLADPTKEPVLMAVNRDRVEGMLCLSYLIIIYRCYLLFSYVAFPVVFARD